MVRYVCRPSADLSYVPLKSGYFTIARGEIVLPMALYGVFSIVFLLSLRLLFLSYCFLVF